MQNLFTQHFPLMPNRAHEATGAGAVTFAAITCGLGAKPAMWIVEAWQGDTLNPVALAEFCDPKKLLMARASNAVDVLAVAEESLRSGAVSTVVAELTQPINLTAGRRLQLAAEAGKSTGVFIISDGAGSNATQTRWHCAPIYDETDSTLMRWKLIKNKTGTLTGWKVRWDEQARRVIVVSTAGE